MPSYPLKIVPFTVPEAVTFQMPPGRREDGMQQAATLAIVDLPRETVLELCEEFTNRLLAAYDQTQRLRVEQSAREHHRGFGGSTY